MRGDGRNRGEWIVMIFCVVVLLIVFTHWNEIMNMLAK